jgi:hypothetical protein
MNTGFINAVSSEIVTATKDDKKIIIVNDRHIDEKVNKKGPFQRAQLLQNLDALNKQASRVADRLFLIAEDMLNYEGQNTVVKAYMANESEMACKQNQQELKNAHELGSENNSNPSIEQTISVIGNLILDCNDLGIDCYNAECRQTKWVSRNEDFITGADIVKEFEYNRQSILDDLEIIKKDAEENKEARVIYDACVKIMKQSDVIAHSSIEYLRNAHMSLKQLEKEQQADFMKDYNGLFDLYLVDARILISWYKNRFRNTTVIIAGEVHLENVLQAFELLGYEIERHGTKYSADDTGMLKTVENCLNMDSFFRDVMKIGDSSSSLFNRIAQNFEPATILLGSVVTTITNGVYQFFQAIRVI